MNTTTRQSTVVTLDSATNANGTSAAVLTVTSEQSSFDGVNLRTVQESYTRTTTHQKIDPVDALLSVLGRKPTVTPAPRKDAGLVTATFPRAPQLQ